MTIWMKCSSEFYGLRNRKLSSTVPQRKWSLTSRHIFDLLDRTALTDEDVLVDIGSGLGHVSMLTSIWTRAHSVGIEVEPAYVDCAHRTAESLNLRRVNFIQQDARAADFAAAPYSIYTRRLVARCYVLCWKHCGVKRRIGQLESVRSVPAQQ